MSVHQFTKALQDCDSQSARLDLYERFLLMLRKNRLKEMAMQLLLTPVPLIGGPGFFHTSVKFSYD